MTVAVAEASIGGAPPLSDREFRLFQGLIHREAGIYLSDAKRALLIGRLSRRMRELGMPTFESYFRHVVEGPDPSERVRMINAICTHETSFFREPRQFELLEQTILPAWRAAAEAGERPRRVRAWSAACSSGEEPFSIAMSLQAHLPAPWDVEVLATDLSTSVLDRARSAVWKMERSATIPPAYLKRFMLRGRAGGPHADQMKAGPELRAAVRFQQLNLNDPSYAVGGPFDMIFCRNVLIYFDQETKIDIFERLNQVLEADGMLLLGAAESVVGITDAFRPCPDRRGLYQPNPARARSNGGAMAQGLKVVATR